MNTQPTEKLIVRVNENPVLNIHGFCKRHRLLPKFSADKKLWILRPMPDKAPMFGLIESIE